MVYYSGHGWLNETDERYYLLPHDIKLLPHDIKLARLAASALSADVFTEALRQIPTERLLVVIDSCRAAKMLTSNEPEEIIREVEKIDTELADEFDNFKRVSPSWELVEQLKQGKGPVLFVSSSGEENSWTHPNGSYSVYAYHFLEALQGAGNQPGDTEVRVSNAMSHLSKTVSETVRQFYNKKQTPNFDMATEDFAIALLLGGKGLPDKGSEEVKPEATIEVKPEATQKNNKISEELKQILNRIENGEETEEDINVLPQLLSDGVALQLGKYNVSFGEGMEWNDEAIAALIEEYKFQNLKDGCRDRDALKQYLEGVLQRLKQQGCSDIRKDVVLDSRRFNYIARMSEFELPSMLGKLPFGALNRRGEAFFMFFEFDSLQMKTLNQFSLQCFKWAKEQVKLSGALEAIYNGREPTHICFAIAIVDELDEETRVAVRTTNPFNHLTDLLWYVVPVVYELEREQLLFYEKSNNLLDRFVGMGIWDSLRKVVREYLMPSSQIAQ